PEASLTTSADRRLIAGQARLVRKHMLRRTAWLIIGFLIAAPASAAPPVVERGIYACASERVRINTCGWYCQVVYPDRPGDEGAPVWAVEHVDDVAARLGSCTLVETLDGRRVGSAQATSAPPARPANAPQSSPRAETFCSALQAIGEQA